MVSWLLRRLLAFVLTLKRSFHMLNGLLADPTVSMVGDSVMDASTMVASAKATRLFQAIARKAAERIVGADGLSQLDTPLGKAFIDLLTPVVMHGVLTHGPGAQIYGAEMMAELCGHSFRGQSVYYGIQYAPELDDVYKSIKGEIDQLREIAMVMVAARGVLSSPVEQPVMGTRTAQTVGVPR